MVQIQPPKYRPPQCCVVERRIQQVLPAHAQDDQYVKDTISNVNYKVYSPLIVANEELQR